MINFRLIPLGLKTLSKSRRPVGKGRKEN